MSDSASLQNLNDIVLPPPVALWPPAPGWYVLFAALLIGILWLAFRQWRHWRRNRYRRQALVELARIRKDPNGDLLPNLPGLLKRTALAAWPRESVASLSGEAWHGFLDESAGMNRFSGRAGPTLDCLAYSGQSRPLPPGRDITQLLDASEYWLKRHVCPDGAA